MPVLDKQVVSFHYTVKDDAGEVVDSSVGNDPLVFMKGADQILPALENILCDMAIGERKSVTLAPTEAYGDLNEELIQTMERSQFPDDVELEAGMQFTARDEHGHQYPFVLTKVGDEEVTIDYNHPMAGKTLYFDVELLAVRNATDEEISHGHAHGAHGHHLH